MKEYLEINRKLWDHWADLHPQSDFYDAEAFRKNPMTLHEIEKEPHWSTQNAIHGYANKKPALRAGFLINSISGINAESGKESFDTEPKSYSI